MIDDPVSVLALATAVPPHLIAQAEIARRAGRVFGRTLARYPQLAEVFAHAGIEQRYAVRPIDWYEAPRGISERTDTYVEAGGDLFVAAATTALDRARLDARDVDIVVTISSTGIATPSLEARVARRLGLKAGAMRVPVFGLGCAGGVAGLAIGACLARGAPGRVVLVVAVETCTLAFRSDGGRKADVVATALFGDGAAAAVLQAGTVDSSVARLGAAGEHFWPGTLDIMGWTVDPLGFAVVLSRALPRFIERRLGPPARKFVAARGFAAPPRFICHLGSVKVLAAIESALGLEPGALADERAILRRHGNMSSPSVMFVLERALACGYRGAAVLAALGPGFTASFLAVEMGHGSIGHG